MSAVPQTNMLAALARLPMDEAPWQLSFELWTQAEAQRWRAAMAISSKGRLALLADREREPLLQQRIEARLRRALRWVACPAGEIDALLGAGEAGFRALQDLDEGIADSSAGEQAQELSALKLSEQASPVVRLLDATLYDALQDGASDVHFETHLRGLKIR